MSLCSPGNGDDTEPIYFVFALKQTRVAREQTKHRLPDKVIRGAFVSVVTGQRWLVLETMYDPATCLRCTFTTS